MRCAPSRHPLRLQFPLQWGVAERLITAREFDELEGLVARHRGLAERLEQLERDAAAFDTPAQGVLELSRKADAARLELAEVLERLLARVKR